MNTSLYNKYRPRTLEEILENEDLVQSIKNLTSKKEPPHAYLLHGMAGCGKTTMARIIARLLGCKGRDVMEKDIADYGGVDMARELRKNARLRPMAGQRKVYIMDECHQLTKEAQNVLLKLLEEPPEYTFFVLCTTEPSKLKDTVRSRCILMGVDTLASDTLVKHMRDVCKKEGHDCPPKDVLNQIAVESLGSARTCLVALEKIIGLDPEKMKKAVESIMVEQSESIELCRALIKGSKWAVISKILRGIGSQNPESVRRHVLSYATSVLLNTDNPRAYIVIQSFIDNVYDSGQAGLVSACYEAVNG